MTFRDKYIKKKTNQTSRNGKTLILGKYEITPVYFVNVTLMRGKFMSQPHRTVT